MFHKNKTLKPQSQVVSQRVVSRAHSIEILDIKEKVSFGETEKKYADGVVEYGTFDGRTGLLTQGMRIYPKSSSHYDTTQKYEKGRFENGVLLIGEEFNLTRNYGETYSSSAIIVDKLRLQFKYDSDYHEDMLYKAWFQDKSWLEAVTTYMRTAYSIDQATLLKIHAAYPELKTMDCASIGALNNHYLRRSSDFVEKLLDLAFKKALGKEFISVVKEANRVKNSP